MDKGLDVETSEIKISDFSPTLINLSPIILNLIFLISTFDKLKSIASFPMFSNLFYLWIQFKIYILHQKKFSIKNKLSI